MKKTHSPTAKKLKRARDDGDIAKSGELSALVTASSGLVLLVFLLFYSQQFLINPHNLFNCLSGNETSIRLIFLLILFHCVLAFVLFFVSVVVEMLQVGFYLNFGLVKPKASRINPVSGFRRMFGIPEEESPASIFQSPIFEAFKWLAFLAAPFCSLYFFRFNIAGAAMNSEPTAENLARLSLLAIGPASCVFFILSLTTLWTARRLQTLRLSMDREELKREFRESEGREEQKQMRHEACLELYSRAQHGERQQGGTQHGGRGKVKFVVKGD